MGIAFEYPEGATPIDPEEAEGLIPSLSTQGELNEFEATNIAEATAWVERSKNIKRNLLDLEILRVLHKRMFDKTWRWAGCYRTTQKNIGCDASQISTKTMNLINDVKCWMKLQTYPPDEIAARFHHRLVSIHAFPNGNGRHARLATDLLCEMLGLKPMTWGSANLVARGNARTNYLSALRSADKHDMAPLISFMRT